MTHEPLSSCCKAPLELKKHPGHTENCRCMGSPVCSKCGKPWKAAPAEQGGEMERLIARVELCRPVSEQLKRVSKYDGTTYTWPMEKGDCNVDDYAEWMYEDVAPQLIAHIRSLQARLSTAEADRDRYREALNEAQSILFCQSSPLSLEKLVRNANGVITEALFPSPSHD